MDLTGTGLTKNESRVYLALLELGLASAKPIIDKTGMHRQIVYDSLNFLIDKGLVSFVIQANRKHFRANEPKLFRDYFDKKKKEVEKEREEFEKLLPFLESKSKTSPFESEEVTVYRSIKGIKSLIDNMLSQRDEILTLGASDVEAEAFKYHLNFNLPLFHKMRAEKKLNLRILLSEDLKDRSKYLKRFKFTSVKLLPREFTSNSSTNIYGNKVSIIMWGREPFGVLIESRDIAEAQRKHFELLWKMAKPK